MGCERRPVRTEATARPRHRTRTAWRGTRPPRAAPTRPAPRRAASPRRRAGCPLRTGGGAACHQASGRCRCGQGRAQSRRQIDAAAAARGCEVREARAKRRTRMHARTAWASRGIGGGGGRKRRHRSGRQGTHRLWGTRACQAEGSPASAMRSRPRARARGPPDGGRLRKAGRTARRMKATRHRQVATRHKDIRDIRGRRLPAGAARCGHPVGHSAAGTHLVVAVEEPEDRPVALAGFAGPLGLKRRCRSRQARHALGPAKALECAVVCASISALQWQGSRADLTLDVVRRHV